MKIYTNLSAMNSRRMYNQNEGEVAQSLRRLSSGLRVNSAKDDAAGLAISDRMTSQVRGLRVGQKNVNDGISMLQTAEGGLQEVTNMLQRMRELSVQAANTAINGPDERRKLQNEVEQLTAEITRIAKSTEFNGINILDDRVQLNNLDGADPKVQILYGLKASWLQQSENAITDWFGLTADNADLEIIFDEPGTAGGALAWVTSTTFDPTTGLSGGLSLTIDMADFSTKPELPNGGDPWMYYDRIVAHEMVHAVMNRTVNMQALPTWFKEGAAELIHGADQRVEGDTLAGSMANNITAWDSSSAAYSKGYLAARYINDLAIAAGKTMEDVFNELEATRVGAGAATYLYDALNTVTGAGFTGEADFMTKFTNYVTANWTDATFAENGDSGAIGGADANGVSLRDTSDEGVVADLEQPMDNPTEFNIISPFEIYNNEGPTQFMAFQVGANKGQVIRTGFAAASAKALNIEDVDLVNNPSNGMVKYDAAIDFVSRQRARLGAQQNRLEAAARVNEISVENLSASRSRIMDADYAVETSAMTKGMIINQAATAMLSQAQTAPQLALQLLQGV